MGRRNTNNNSSNILSQQKILNELNQMTQNDVKGQLNNNNNSRNGSRKNSKKNQKQQQQQQQQQPAQQPAQQQVQQQQSQSKPQQKQKSQQPQKPDTSVKGTSKLFSSWDYYTNFEWKNNPRTYVQNITEFANRGDLKAQVDKVQEIQIKYTYKPEKKSREELRKLNKRRVKEMASKFPPDMHSYRMKQLLKEINNNRQQRATHERVTNLLVQRYTNRMNEFAQEYQKAYKTYQESIKENLGVEHIKNSKINAHKMGSYQRRQQKKEKMQKKQFRRERKRILESHTSPAQWTPANEKLFQMATQMILGHGYDGFHYFRRPEYNRSLAWVEANENSTTKESISTASIMACQNSPIPGEQGRLASYRVPTVPPTQKPSSTPKETEGQSKKPQQPKQKRMTIKTQTPEQYRQRISGGKKQKQFKNAHQPSEEGNGREKGNNNSPRPKEQKPVSPSVVNPGPATWVQEPEYPNNFAWGILQHQPNGQEGRNGKRGGKKQKDEVMNLLFPTSAPNTNGGTGRKKPPQNNKGNENKKQNRRPQGVNISEML